MTVLRYYGWFFILCGLFLSLPPWFGMGPVGAAVCVVGSLGLIGVGVAALVYERRGERLR